MIPALLVPVSYLLGAVPTSYVAGRVFRGLDLREHGSGNLGATNALRVLGWRLGLVVFAVDVFKGWLPVFAFPRLAGVGVEWGLGFGAAAIVGHVFSVFVGFRGGKGVATSAGVFLALAPAAVATALVIWLVLVGLTRTVSLGSIAAAVSVPVVVYLVQGVGAVFGVAVAAALLVVVAHRANIRRLLRGEEHRFERSRGASR